MRLISNLCLQCTLIIVFTRFCSSFSLVVDSPCANEPILKDIAFNTLRPRQNGHHFPDDVFKCIFLNENVWISLQISLKLVPKVRINNIPVLVQIMACRRSVDKPLSEPMIVSLLAHICVTRPQRVEQSLANPGKWQTVCVILGIYYIFVRLNPISVMKIIWCRWNRYVD